MSITKAQYERALIEMGLLNPSATDVAKGSSPEESEEHPVEQTTSEFPDECEDIQRQMEAAYQRGDFNEAMRLRQEAMRSTRSNNREAAKGAAPKKGK
jgi:excinuclease UvrABC helicase subunit UvrB